MHMKTLRLLLASTLITTGIMPFGGPGSAGAAEKKASWKKTDGLYAIFETSMGTITCRLFENETPKTVANFIELAQGTKEWTDPRSGQVVKRPLYDSSIFHRVIPQFMIQGGCPLGNGMGGPGYRFEDEFVSGLQFDAPGKLAMANSGPNTNGSQFFITEVPTPWLNNHHTIFGEVVEGMELVTKIANVPTAANNRPATDVLLKKVTITRIGAEAAPAKKQPKSSGILNGKKVLMVVAPRGFRDEEYFEPKKILSDAGAQVVTASLTKGDLYGMLGAKITADILLQEARAADYDAVVFIGGAGAQVYWNNPIAHKLATDAFSAGKITAAICVAPVTLAQAGITKGKRVTCFPSAKADVAAQGAQCTDMRVEVDGNLITASGPEASQEFGQALLNALH